MFLPEVLLVVAISNKKDTTIVFTSKTCKYLLVRTHNPSALIFI